MDYEKKYKEALENMRRFRDALNNHEETDLWALKKEIVTDIEYYFPELKDSEDEKIRKALIKYCKLQQKANNIGFCGISLIDAIAWLEKQDAKDKLIKELGEYKDKYIQKILSQQLEKRGENMKAKSEVIKDYTGEENVWNNACDFRPKHMQRCLCYDKYMGGVYCYVYDDISKYWCTQTTEEHDPDGDNHICDYADYRVTVWMCLPKTTFYPKKQEYNVDYYQVDDEVGNLNDWVITTSNDKVEPKFKTGNWYQCIKDFYGKGVRFDAGKAYYCSADGCLQESDESAHIVIDYNLYDRFRLWTIADAKDGDVLVDSLSGHNQITILFKCIELDTSIRAYCGWNCYNFRVTTDGTGYGTLSSTKYVPATKERRDTLFAKMKEAGYEWDAENKELQLIKHEWKNGDIVRLKKDDGKKFMISKTEGENYLWFISEISERHVAGGWISQLMLDSEYEFVSNPRDESLEKMNNSFVNANSLFKLWKTADGDELPPYDKEVIVLTQPKWLSDNMRYAVYFGHRPNTNGDAMTFNGWNIEDVKYWLDLELPES